MSRTFEVLATSGAARAGRLRTAHGEVETPVFMPVGTQATVKALSSADLEALGAPIILGNTYHLAMRPGRRVSGSSPTSTGHITSSPPKMS